MESKWPALGLPLKVFNAATIYYLSKSSVFHIKHKTNSEVHMEDNKINKIDGIVKLLNESKVKALFTNMEITTELVWKYSQYE